MPQQRQLVRWARRRSAIPIWMAMRLGKTLSAKRWMDTRPGAHRILVVAPLAAIPGWYTQLTADGVSERSMAVLTGTWRQRERAFERGVTDQARWFLINYEGLTLKGRKTKSGKPKAVPADIARLPWDGVILDESPKIRNPKANVTRVCLDYLSQARYTACLSGLPNPEGGENFVTQMLFLFGEFMGCRDFWSWRQEHMQPMGGGGWVLKGKTIGPLRAEVKRLSFMMSKKDAGIGSKLIRETRFVALPSAVMREIDRARTHLEVGDKLTNIILESLTWQTQLAGGCYPHDDSFQHSIKTRELVYLATTELAREPLVVAARYTAELEAAILALMKAKISCGLVHGQLKDNAGTVQAFQRGEFRVLVCQPKVLQMGVDLSRSSTMICLSRWWDHEVNAQFEERTEHPAKKEPRLVVDIVARDTVDEDIVLALAEKTATAKMFTRRFLQLVRRRML